MTWPDVAHDVARTGYDVGDAGHEVEDVVIDIGGIGDGG